MMNLQSDCWWRNQVEEESPSFLSSIGDPSQHEQTAIGNPSRRQWPAMEEVGTRFQDLFILPASVIYRLDEKIERLWREKLARRVC
jgi:hypothetical protein